MSDVNWFLGPIWYFRKSDLISIIQHVIKVAFNDKAIIIEADTNFLHFYSLQLPFEIVIIVTCTITE